MITKGELMESGEKKKQKIIRKTDEIKNIIENYKYMEKDYIYNGYDRKDIVELWEESDITYVFSE
ncbi:hypothetical protein BCR32DRAFT_282028 [Anaeromyces robustus]|uniref:Uncharacterized protein n=1 Tax=Anaeromyces robustus TaxID=1754192 RepID=A0A1Y1WZA2_9FUNG|nr:hypothetical protein BCR32DRAFT_282028 [Anaeromyces robustus]|eukprot:ORX78725.1 hypothetical protein BCR32DRAFT_282028 [Anaeromyces robustus]